VCKYSIILSNVVSTYIIIIAPESNKLGQSQTKPIFQTFRKLGGRRPIETMPIILSKGISLQIMAHHHRSFAVISSDWANICQKKNNNNNQPTTMEMSSEYL